MRLLRFALLSCLCVFSSALNAQVATGVYRFGSFDSRGADTINVGNLNVNLSVPVLQKAGRGLPFSYALTFDSSVWYPSGAAGSQSWKPVDQWGWKGDSNAVTGFVSYDTSTSTFINPDGAPVHGQPARCTVTTYSNWVYYDSYGIAHTFTGSTGKLTSGDGDTCPNNASFSAMADDGSAYSLSVNFWRISSVSTPQGIQVVPATIGTTNGTITDRNGNQLTVDASGHFTDTTGNVALTVAGAAPSSKTFTYKDTTGANQSVTMSYAAYTVQTAFGCSGISEYPATAQYLVDRITFPDASYYAFTYEATPGLSGKVTGRVATVRVPTGGTITYTYTGGSNGITCLDGSTSGLTRYTTATAFSPASTVTYVRSSSGTGFSHTDVTDGRSRVSQYDFVLPSNLPTNLTALLYAAEVKVFDGAATGTPVKATEICLGQSSPCYASRPVIPATSEGDLITLNGVQNYVASVGYSSLSGNQISSYSSDFSTGTPTTELLRSTVTEEILSGGVVVPAVTASTVTHTVGTTSSGTMSVTDTINKTEYLYDEATPATTTGVPMHTSVSSGRGNVTTTRSYVDSNISNAIISTAIYDDTGNVLSSADPYHGSSSFNFDTLTHAYQTSVTPALSGLAVGVAYETSYTGLPTSASDPNASTYIPHYDAMLRPTEVDYPDGGVTTLTHPSPKQSGQTRNMSAGTEDTESILDDYGRPVRTAIQYSASPIGWYLQDTCYDSNGAVSFVSVRYAASSLTGTSACSGAGTTYDYDVLGRLHSVQQTGSTAAVTTYSGRTIKTVDENGVTKLTKMDGLGRVSAVCEVTSVTMPNSGAPVSCGMDIAGTGYLTTYNYDLANHTTIVMQGAQSRTFVTDWLGRTISVTEPESGTTTYTYSSNSTGMVVTRVKPRANQTNAAVKTTATIQYDTAGRIISIGYDDGTPTKTYGYDEASGGGATLLNGKGRLTSFSTGSTQGFYGYDPVGRVSLSSTCLPSSNCAATPIFKQLAYTYDHIGNLMTADDGVGGTSSYTYTIASEPLTLGNRSASIVSSTTYGAFGQQAAALGNGLNAVNGYDPLGRVNGRWVCSGSVSTYCTGGTVKYGATASWSGTQLSGSSDTVSGQALNYGYDDMNRLASLSVASGSGANYTYSYDRWGNRQSQSATTGGISVSTVFDYVNNSNRITSAGGSSYTYDAAGNVTGDGIYSYSYDAEGNMVGVSGGTTATYVYDAVNHRVATVTSTGTQQFLFHPGGQRAATLDGSGTAVSTPAYFAGSAVAFYKGGAFHYQHQDWLGTERMRTSSAGTTDGTYTSLPFGDALNTASGTDDDPSHYTGHDQDYETSTVHAQFRQYNPPTGTWMQPDPYIESYDAGNPQSLNRYAYVGNNPLVYSDPMGLQRQGWGADGCYYDETDEWVGAGTSSDDPMRRVVEKTCFGTTGGPIYSANFFIPCSHGLGCGGVSTGPQASNNPKPCGLSKALGDGNWQSLALDAASIAAGFLPGGGLVTGSAKAARTAFAVQAGLTAASTANSVAYKSAPGEIAGILGGQVTLTTKLAESIAVDIGKALPVVGVAVSTGALIYDAYMTYKAYTPCPTGGG